MSNHILNPVKNDPQSIGSAITYARRYSISTMLGLVQSDDDGNAASGKSSKQKTMDEAAENSQGEPDYYEIAADIEVKLKNCKTINEHKNVCSEYRSTVNFMKEFDVSLYDAVITCKDLSKERIIKQQ